MKKNTLFLALLISLMETAQQDSIPIPMKNGIVFYEKADTINFKGKKEQAAVRALQWFGKSFGSVQDGLKVADVKKGDIEGTGIFKVPVSESGNYFWVQMQVKITVQENGYLFQAFDYYEKPIEKGVSNEYSKIEYRWRDFRKGKPWSSEDQKLFEGIHSNTLAIMNSLKKEMNK